MKRLHLFSAVLYLGSAGYAQDGTRSPGWVVIPVNQYEALHGKAFPVERAADPPPVEATLTRIDYDLRLDGVLAAGRASLTVDVVKDGWVRVPIPPGLLVRSARLGGKPVSLVGGRSDQMAVLSGKGRSVLLLDVAFNVTSSDGASHLSVPVGASGVTRASVEAVPQDVEVNVGGGFVAEKSAAHWLAYARGNEPLSFTWRKKIEERRVELPLRMRGSLVQLFGLGEDSTSLNAEVEIEAIQGSARQVRIEVPSAVTINQVPGALVADWDVQGGQLVVNFLEPVEQVAKFTISGETHLARDGAIDIPLLKLLDCERESGAAAVEVLGAGEIKDSRAEGLEAVEGGELGPMLAGRQSPSLTAFRLRTASQARSLNVQVARYAQQAVLTANVEEARYRVLTTVEGKTLVQARYAIRNNQRNFVRITLPTGAAVWSASLAGRPVHPGKTPDGGLVFPLAKSGPPGAAGEDAPLFPIEILYLAHGAEWGGRGRATLPLPALDLPVSRTGVMLYYPPLFRVTPETGAFRAQPYEPPSSPALSAAAGAPAFEAAQNVSAGLAPSATQALVDKYRARSDARRASTAFPIHVSFPAMGPSLYLATELTGESQAPVIELDYQKEKKGGVK